MFIKIYDLPEAEHSTLVALSDVAASVFGKKYEFSASEKLDELDHFDNKI